MHAFQLTHAAEDSKQMIPLHFMKLQKNDLSGYTVGCPCAAAAHRDLEPVHVFRTQAAQVPKVLEFIGIQMAAVIVVVCLSGGDSWKRVPVKEEE